MSAMGAGEWIGADVLSREWARLMPLSEPLGLSSRINLDGVVAFSVARGEPEGTVETLGYVQAFRHGSIEAVDIAFFGEVQNKPCIYDDHLERCMISGFRRLSSVQQDLGVEPPIIVALSLLGVRGYRMASHAAPGVYRTFDNTIDRDDLLIAEQVVESFDQEPDVVLRPVFNAIWNAADAPASPHYDTSGRHKHRPASRG